MNNFIMIKSTDDTDVFFNIDEVQYVIETNSGCIIGFKHGDRICSGAKFEDVIKAIHHYLEVVCNELWKNKTR